MATLVNELDLPEITPDERSFEERHANKQTFPEGTWLARNLFGYTVWGYEDVTAILRDKRWHSAVGRLPEMMGVTDEQFLAGQKVSILSAEGDVHQRLRRLVAPAFSPRQTERLRPVMRSVINELVDRVAVAGRADYIVSADADLLTLRAVQGIPILDVPSFWGTQEGVAP